MSAKIAVLAATATPAAASENLTSSLFRIIDHVRDYRARRRTHLMLSDLEGHILDDIGVDPSHVRGTRPGAVDWCSSHTAGRRG